MSPTPTRTPIPDADVQLVVFDLMGTLLVDDDIVARAYERALQQAGFEHGSDRILEALQRVDKLRGRPTLVVLSEVVGDPIAAEEATWAFDDSILGEAEGFAAIDGANDTLDILASRGVLCAVTTSFSPEVRKAALAVVGWHDRFAATLSAHGLRRGHPAPDLLLEAIVELRIDSVAQVAIVGDTAADLEAGNRAGAGLVIGVRSGRAPEKTLIEAPHTHLIDSVADVIEVLDAPRIDGQRRMSDR